MPCNTSAFVAVLIRFPGDRTTCMNVLEVYRASLLDTGPGGPDRTVLAGGEGGASSTAPQPVDETGDLGSEWNASQSTS